MARNAFAITTSAEVALSAATEKTILQIVAPTNTILAIQGFDISFDGISNTAEPVMVKLVRTTTAGTGTSRTPLATKDRSTALAATGTENHTVEGTNGNIVRIFHVHPQAGALNPFPLTDAEVEVPGAGRLALKVTAPATVNCLATIYGEE